MSTFDPVLVELMSSLQCLPGVGAKSAQRMALHLLERKREAGLQLATHLTKALSQLKRCDQCRMPTVETTCPLCSSPRRDGGLLCVVETPADVLAVEQGTEYRGRYFVLLGRLSPLDGIGPEELGIQQLEQQLASGTVTELILATNPTVEGEATAHFLTQLADKHGVKTSRIAYGVPVGGELEYADAGTLSHAFSSRG